MVFVRKRRLHDFHKAELEKAGATSVILFSNNSRAEFKEVSMLVPDKEQIEQLLGGDPLE